MLNTFGPCIKMQSNENQTQKLFQNADFFFKTLIFGLKKKFLNSSCDRCLPGNCESDSFLTAEDDCDSDSFLTAEG